ncbi:MAG: hypothetical protein L0Y57_13640 [Beijerinckiaceae bacterium]|nr:hypothetical protein [Beijerinckiaceae bacterium]MCI0598145.1 hypothetical protein [Beijerinckiaceae bacterium]MCI0734977.1 hypothetical protein [Beijerinckiaceae bacterium]
MPNCFGAAERPNQIWLANISYVPSEEVWLCMAAVPDLFTRKIVEWAMRDPMRKKLTIAALTMTIMRQGLPNGLMHYSGRHGSQFVRFQ